MERSWAIEKFHIKEKGFFINYRLLSHVLTLNISHLIIYIFVARLFVVFELNIYPASFINLYHREIFRCLGGWRLQRFMLQFAYKIRLAYLALRTPTARRNSWCINTYFALFCYWILHSVQKQKSKTGDFVKGAICCETDDFAKETISLIQSFNFVFINGQIQFHIHIFLSLALNNWKKWLPLPVGFTIICLFQECLAIRLLHYRNDCKHIPVVHEIDTNQFHNFGIYN